MNSALHITNLVVRRGREFLLELGKLDLEGGRLYALIGPSGIGKSTLLRALGGLIPIENGNVVLESGISLSLPSPGSDDLVSWRRRLHVVGQGQALLPHMSVLANTVALERDYGYDSDDVSLRVRFDRATKLLGISHLIHRYPSELSGGQYARALLARSLTYHPTVLLMDEISASIDPPIAYDIFKAVRTELTASGRIGVFVTHYVEMARRVADQVIFLSEPNCISVYEPHELEATREPAVERFLLKR